MRVGRRFARLAANVATRFPPLWRVFRGPMRANFDRIAADWDDLRVTERYLAPLTAALATIEAPPARVLDVGTGNGAAARVASARWADAAVVGVDLSPAMVEQARARGGPREQYQVADASRLPFPDASFDLVTLVNMIPFFDELARMVAPGGAIAIAYTRGARTPIWVPLERVGRELARRGLTRQQTVEAGDGVALVARA